MLELIVSRYGLRDRLEIDSIEEGRRLAESLSEQGEAYPFMIVDGDTVIVSYQELMGKWCAENLPVDEAMIARGA